MLNNSSLFSDFKSFCAKIKSCRIKSNLISDEAKALRNLTKKNGIIIQIADKGNTYENERLSELLSDTSKCERFEIPRDKYFNFAIKDIINPYNHLLKNANFSNKTSNELIISHIT